MMPVMKIAIPTVTTHFWRITNLVPQIGHTTPVLRRRKRPRAVSAFHQTFTMGRSDAHRGHDGFVINATFYGFQGFFTLGFGLTILIKVIGSLADAFAARRRTSRPPAGHQY
jgi:hypothetical protein